MFNHKQCVYNIHGVLFKEKKSYTGPPRVYVEIRWSHRTFQGPLEFFIHPGKKHTTVTWVVPWNFPGAPDLTDSPFFMLAYFLGTYKQMNYHNNGIDKSTFSAVTKLSINVCPNTWLSKTLTSVQTRGLQWSFWRRARRPGRRRLGRRLWSRPRSTGVHSASLHQSSVCPNWFDKIIHFGCLTLCRKRALDESFWSRLSVIKSTFYSVEFVTDARTCSV